MRRLPTVNKCIHFWHGVESESCQTENNFPREYPAKHVSCQMTYAVIDITVFIILYITYFNVASDHSKLWRPTCLSTCHSTIRRGPQTRWDSSRINSEETISMMTFVLNSLARLHKDEAGQALVEYLLILALVAFAATAGMGSLASGLNSAFSQIGIILGNYIT